MSKKLPAESEIRILSKVCFIHRQLKGLAVEMVFNVLVGGDTDWRMGSTRLR